MSSIKRIKKLMSLNEQEQRPVTSPLPIKNLVVLLNYIYKNDPSLFDDINDYEDISFIQPSSDNNDKLIDHIFKFYPMVNISKSDILNIDNQLFISAFILENLDVIKSNSRNPSDYTIPRLKQYLVTGYEDFTANIREDYELKVEAYNELSIYELISENAILLGDGTLKRSETLDTWDVEQEIETVEEIPSRTGNMNEEIDLDDYKPDFTTEDFLNYVNSEYDLEMLTLMKGAIQKRINFLNRLVAAGQRPEFTGFKKFD